MLYNPSLIVRPVVSLTKFLCHHSGLPLHNLLPSIHLQTFKKIFFIFHLYIFPQEFEKNKKTKT